MGQVTDMKKKFTIENEPITSIVESPAAVYTLAASSNPFLNLVRSIFLLLGIPNESSAHPPIKNNADFIDIIRDGIPRKSIDHLMENTGLTVVEISNIIRTSDRTLRRYTAKQKLNPEQTERILELARLYSRGEEVFGQMEKFKSWMNNPVMALGNKKPKEFLDTSIGIELLMNELGRIEHGIFA